MNDLGKLLVLETCFGFLSMSGPVAMDLKSGTRVYFTKLPGSTTIRYEREQDALLAASLLSNSWPSHVLRARVLPIEQAAQEATTPAFDPRTTWTLREWLKDWAERVLPKKHWGDDLENELTRVTTAYEVFWPMPEPGQELAMKEAFRRCSRAMELWIESRAG